MSSFLKVGISITVLLQLMSCRTTSDSKTLSGAAPEGSSVKPFEYAEASFEPSYAASLKRRFTLDTSKICVLAETEAASGITKLRLYNYTCASMKNRIERGAQILTPYPDLRIVENEDQAKKPGGILTYFNPIRSDTTTVGTYLKTGKDSDQYTITNFCQKEANENCSFTTSSQGTFNSISVGAVKFTEHSDYFLAFADNVNALFGSSVSTPTTTTSQTSYNSQSTRVVNQSLPYFCDFVVKNIQNDNSPAKGFEILWVKTDVNTACTKHRESSFLKLSSASKREFKADNLAEDYPNLKVTYDWPSDTFSFNTDGNGSSVVVFTRRPDGTSISESKLITPAK